ncbi:hypothetical protein K488DRAFT_85295 [Vararia minispora EC-137]|uniref:Uncharacterized protein n=1 Tax=Vararia minispora EC-137 TaxID=1314806 RepID=A0ACB8QN57_9AGAM|nr:hypothetical protein K488DRAFT_85295 [Vararia minispora EC-137]
MVLAPIAVIRCNEVCDLGWIKLSHVCRTWRYQAIACQYAWASSVGQLPRATQVFLERAGSTPVDVIITGERPLLPSQAMAFSSADEASVDSILECIDFHRVRVLTVADGRAHVFPFATHLNEQGSTDPLASLTHVILEAYSWNISRREAVYLASAGCCLNAPNLETLRLKNCFMDLECEALTSLDIQYDGSLLPRPSAAIIVEALSCCPALTTLRLHNALCVEEVIDITDDPFGAFLIVELRDLEYLSATGPAHSLEDLLTHLSFPPATVVHLDACIWPVGAPDIVRQLARPFREHLLQDFVTVAVDHDVHYSQQLTRVRMWKKAGLVNLGPAIRFGVSSDDSGPRPHFEVTVRDHSPGRWVTVVNCFARRLEPDSVRSLALSLPSAEFSAEAVPRWIEILDRFPRLTVLYPKLRIELISMPNAIVIYPNGPGFNVGPALASRDNMTSLMVELNLPCEVDGRIGDDAIANFLACDVRQVCNFFNPKRTIFRWHYSMYAGSSGPVNEVACVVRKDTSTVIRGPVVVVKDTPQNLWSTLDTTVRASELASSIWTYHRTGLDVGQVYSERALIRWLGSS